MTIQPAIPTSHSKELNLALTLIGIAVGAFTIWEIYQSHKYRKLQYELDLLKVQHNIQ